MSGLPTKQWMLDAAEVFDAWRVFPRVLVGGYWLWVALVVHDILQWYKLLPSPERTLEASGLAGAVITAVTGMATWVSKIYMDGGRSWANEERE